MGCSEALRGNANVSKHTHKVSTHVRTPNNVSGEHMTMPEKVQKYHKNSQN